MICIPKLALEIRDISLLALLLSPRLDDMYLCTGFSMNSYAEDTSEYIVGKYNISDSVERKSQDEKNISSLRMWLACS